MPNNKMTDTNAAYAPFSDVVAITPHASNTIDPPLRGIIATSDGNLQVKAVNSAAAVTFPVKAGQIVPIICDIVGTDTTAGVVGGR